MEHRSYLLLVVYCSVFLATMPQEKCSNYFMPPVDLEGDFVARGKSTTSRVLFTYLVWVSTEVRRLNKFRNYVVFCS